MNRRMKWDLTWNFKSHHEPKPLIVLLSALIQVNQISCFVTGPSSSQPFLHINNYMLKKHKQTHTQSFEWQASSEWLALLIPDVTQQSERVSVGVCVCVLTVINYLPHAGDLLRLLITSRTKPTGGWFSCTNRESISVWGLVYLRTCTHVTLCPRACVCV